MRRTLWTFVALVVFGALVIAACSGDTDATTTTVDSETDASTTVPDETEETSPPESSDETTLVVARGEDVRDLNPLRQANNGTSEVTYQIHEGLVRLNPDQEIIPVLATSWELQDDDHTWRISLREDVTFHSGAPFNAEAVAWNFEQQLRGDPPGIAAGLLPPYDEITIVDEYTLDVTLTEATSTFPNILGAPLFMMVDPTRYDELGEEYNTNPSGTGAFKYVNWEPGQRVELEKNEEYWDPENAATVDRLVFEVMPEPAARVIALRNGEVDMVFHTPAEDVESLLADGFQVFSTPTMRVVYIGLNTADPILSDVNVRRALGHATNPDQVIDVIGGNGVRADGIGMPDALGFFPSRLPHEPETAMQILEDAGWTPGGDGIRTKDGQRLEVSVITPGAWPGEIEALQVIQSQWAAVGVDMIIDQLADEGSMYTLLGEETAKHVEDPSYVPQNQAWSIGEGVRTGEVGYITERPKCDQLGRNFERYCNQAFDDAFNLSQSTASVEERLEGYEAMARIFEEDAIRLPVWVIQNHIAAAPEVSGFVPNPNESLSLRGVSDED